MLDDHLQQFIRGGPVSDVDSAREQIDEQLRNVPQFEEPRAELQQKLLKTLAPFHIAEHAFEQSIGVGSHPRFPLAPLTKLLPNIKHPTGWLHMSRHTKVYTRYGWHLLLVALATDSSTN